MVLEIVRIKQKEPIPQIEQIIVEGVARVSDIKGCKFGRVTYDTREAFRGTHPSLAIYDSKNDIFYLPRDLDPTLAVHELVHKFQRDYRLEHGFDDSCLSERVNTALLEGDAYRLQVCELVEDGKEELGPRRSRFFSAIVPYSSYAFSFLPLVLNSKERRELRDTARGIRYMRKLYRLGGEPLVNFAYLHNHGDRLTKPKELLQVFNEAA
jgi:hypothetical protein